MNEIEQLVVMVNVLHVWYGAKSEDIKHHTPCYPSDQRVGRVTMTRTLSEYLIQLSIINKHETVNKEQSTEVEL